MTSFRLDESEVDLCDELPKTAGLFDENAEFSLEYDSPSPPALFIFDSGLRETQTTELADTLIAEWPSDLGLQDVIGWKDRLDVYHEHRLSDAFVGCLVLLYQSRLCSTKDLSRFHVSFARNGRIRKDMLGAGKPFQDVWGKAIAYRGTALRGTDKKLPISKDLELNDEEINDHLFGYLLQRYFPDFLVEDIIMGLQRHDKLNPVYKWKARQERIDFDNLLFKTLTRPSEKSSNILSESSLSEASVAETASTIATESNGQQSEAGSHQSSSQRDLSPGYDDLYQEAVPEVIQRTRLEIQGLRFDYGLQLEEAWDLLRTKQEEAWCGMRAEYEDAWYDLRAKHEEASFTEESFWESKMRQLRREYENEGVEKTAALRRQLSKMNQALTTAQKKLSGTQAAFDELLEERKTMMELHDLEFDTADGGEISNKHDSDDDLSPPRQRKRPRTKD